MAQESAAEAFQDGGEHRADLAGSDHPHRLAVNVPAHEAAQPEIELAGPVIGAMDAPVHREEQAHGEFGYGVRGVGAHPHAGDPQARRNGEVKIVESRRALRDQPRPAGRQVFQGLDGRVIVDEDADGGKASGEQGGPRVELRRGEVQIVPPAVGIFQEFSVIGMDVVGQDAHGSPLLAQSWRSMPPTASKHPTAAPYPQT